MAVTHLNPRGSFRKCPFVVSCMQGKAMSLLAPEANCVSHWETLSIVGSFTIDFALYLGVRTPSKTVIYIPDLVGCSEGKASETVDCRYTRPPRRRF
jgi:hypothetical protein